MRGCAYILSATSTPAAQAVRRYKQRISISKGIRNAGQDRQVFKIVEGQEFEKGYAKTTDMSLRDQYHVGGFLLKKRVAIWPRYT